MCTMREQHWTKREHPLPYVSLFNRDTYSVKRKIHTDMFLFTFGDRDDNCKEGTEIFINDDIFEEFSFNDFINLAYSTFLPNTFYMSNFF